MAQIVEKFQERSGKWTVRVANDELTRSMFLSFETEPDNATIRDAFHAALDAERAAQDAQQAEQDAENSEKTTLREAIELYEAGQLTNAQAKNLLEAMIRRARKLGMI